jgi:thiol-disulfide isomerase/thioredoxin
MRRVGLLATLGILVLVLAACAQTLSAQPVDTPATAVEPEVSAEKEAVADPTLVPAPEPAQTPVPAPEPTERLVATPVVTPEPPPVAGDLLLPDQSPPPGAQDQFSTDFGRHTVNYSDVLSGGPPKDGIPAIDEPKLVSIAEADEWLQPNEPVILVTVDDLARAYPIQILMWHEIANDIIGEVPVSVTFCPLCNTGIAFERTFDGQVLDFGTTGRLRYSNLIMYDRQTETWWQQATGEGIAGRYAGQRLEFVPAAMISWEDFRSSYPQGTVLSSDTGYTRDYGRNPYERYDDVTRDPFLYRGPETPGALPAMARVVTIELNDETVAYPYQLLQEIRVANDIVGGEPVAVLWAEGTASALDDFTVAGGADVGAATTYSRRLDGDILSFVVSGDDIVDEETGSVWNILGQAVSGPRGGSRLEPVVSINHFWFSWVAFRPETRIFTPEVSGPDGAAAEGPVSAELEPEPVATVQEPVVEPMQLISDFADFDIVAYQGIDTQGGDSVKFSQVLAQGKPVLLNLWAALCPSCRREMPGLQKAHEEYGDDVLILGIDVGTFVGLGSREDALALLQEFGISYPAGTTPDSGIMRDYQVLGTPANYFLKPDGEIWKKWNGILTEQQLAQNIEGLLEASTPL